VTTTLYKYFSTDEDKLERFINGQIYLTPPKYFNDPWDFKVPCNFTKEHVVKELARDFSPEDAGAYYDEVASKPEFREDEAGEQRNGWSRLIGVVCLTENHLDRLMWSHYGDSHRGFVAEFRCSEFHYNDGDPQAFSSCVSPFGEANKVKYSSQPPTRKEDGSNLKECCLTKHDVWKNENEWRLLRDLKDADLHPNREGFFLLWFKPTDLLRVIVGLEVSSRVKLQLRQMLNHNEFEHVFKEQAYINPKSRNLDTRRLSW